MKIAVIVEGKTEKVFLTHVRRFLQPHLQGRMPRLDPVPYDGRIPKGDDLRRLVRNLLRGKYAADFVIALTDVYTGTNPPEFIDGKDAKDKMRQWVGDEPKFFPHVAQYDFEAWLLPYWTTIQKLAGHNRTAPSGEPEMVNHDNPPARRIREIFRIGRHGKSYVKTRDAARILRDNDLSLAVSRCRELKAFLNTILSLSGGQVLG